jgi:ubiquinone biosynthesis protein
VQDFVDGISAGDRAAIHAAGIDPRVMAQIGADAMFKMVLIDGFFHADPHQGNVLFLPDNRIGFVDFGMVGRLSTVRRQQLVDLLYAMVDRDPAGAAEVLLAWTESTDVSPEQLLTDLDQFIDDYHGAALKEISLARILGELTALIQDHRLSLPPDLSLLFRTLIALDGLGRQNDPDFDIISQATPFLTQALEQRYEPEALARRGWRNAIHLAEVFALLPAELRRLLRLAHRGRLRLHLDLAGLDQFGGQLERAAGWVAISLVTAALIVGSAIVMNLSGGPSLLGLPALGVIGAVLAAASGSWLVMSMRKAARGRRPPRS